MLWGWENQRGNANIWKEVGIDSQIGETGLGRFKVRRQGKKKGRKKRAGPRVGGVNRGEKEGH